MQFKIQNSERELSHIKTTLSRKVRRSELSENLRGNLFLGVRIVGRKAVQYILVPCEIFKHLRRGFDKILRNISAGKTNVLRLRKDRVHRMPKFMEDSGNVAVRHERWTIFCRRRKITNETSGRPLIQSIFKTLAVDDREICEMIKFSCPGKHVHVKHPERRIRIFVYHRV